MSYTYDDEKEMTTRGNLDLEWAMLIVEAKNLGLTAEEIRNFIHNENRETY
jgi:hypothetical protein